MRRFLAFSALAMVLMSGVVGCDSFAGRKPDSEATASTKLTRTTSFTPSTK